jgi:O-acetyl-ADP-ribose deacetylase (regulator of RNase III)
LTNNIDISPMIKVVKGDITQIPVDAIVNAANSSLTDGAGVNGAIHLAGGGDIMQDCLEIVSRQGGCKTGEAVVTRAGKLPAKFVIHAVGPIWHGGNKSEYEMLKNAYTNSLKLAVKKKVKSISFPNISTGVYGFPKDRGAKIAVDAVTDFMKKNKEIEEVIFVCYDEENFALYNKLVNS